MGNDPSTLTQRQAKLYKKVVHMLNEYIDTGNWEKDNVTRVLQVIMGHKGSDALSESEIRLYKRLQLIFNQHIYDDGFDRIDINAILECLV